MAATGTLASYSSIAESELYTHRFSSFGPGFLRDFDLPDLAALIAPRTLLLQNPVDALHRVLAPEAVERTYRSAADVYETVGKRDQMRILAEATAAGIVRRYTTLLPEGPDRPSVRGSK